MSMLQEEVSISNRALAREVGLTEATVAARLRRLFETGTMATTAVVDWVAAGYSARAILRCQGLVGGLSDIDVPRSLPDIHCVTETVGCADVVFQLLTPDLPTLQRAVSDIRSREGWSAVQVDVVTESVKFQIGSSAMPMTTWSARSFPAPRIGLDDIDVGIIDALAVNGQQSNRALARRLAVSEGTIRARQRRMEAAGVLRVVTMVDPISVSGEYGGAFAFICVANDDVDQVVARLKDEAAVVVIEKCLGDADIMAIIVVNTTEELNYYVRRDLPKIPGIRSVDVAIATETWLHRAHLVRLLD